MKARMTKQVLIVALAAILLMSGLACAESAAPVVSAIDPFGASDATGTSPDTGNTGNFVTSDPFTGSTGVPAATALPDAAVNPVVTAVPNNGAAGGTGVGVDLFNVGTPTPAPTIAPVQATPAADPFGTQTIPGYNPFDPSANATLVPTNTVMYVSASSTKIMKEAREDTRTLTTVYFGQQLTVTGTQGDWAQVQNSKGTTGYCRLSSLSAADPNTMSKPMYAQLKRTPVYKTPSQKSRRLRNMKQGDTITAVAITSDGLWYRVTDGNNYGFVPSIYLDDSPAAEGTPVWCAIGSTPVMVNPDNWIEISNLSFGQEVRLVGYTSNNTIAKIRSSKGYVAYCNASALTTASPVTMNTRVYTQVSGQILFRSASDTAKTVRLNKNAQLTLLGVDSANYWALVKFRGQRYYIPYLFIGANRVGNGNRVVVTTTDAPLYRNTTEMITTLPAGTRLTLKGYADGMAAVTTIRDATTVDEQSGYVKLESLRGE